MRSGVIWLGQFGFPDSPTGDSAEISASHWMDILKACLERSHDKTVIKW